ncbi:MAG: LOG family protein [Gammaproteobacteria bacterium]|nr:LOG family protein [Gammaproteobacteria bacterium]
MNDDTDSGGKTPKPADPLRRNTPLPWQTVKSSQDDPDAAQRVERLVNSEVYRRPDRDIQFLEDDDVRGVRLEIDYLKAELHLRKHGIEQTIVVFGGTRITEPAEAQRNVEQLQKALDDDKQNTVVAERLAIAKRILAKSDFYRIAREFGGIVGRSGRGPQDCRVTLMTGGGPGIMEAANRGAFEVGAKSIGLNITLPHEQYPNPYISEELCFSVHYFAIRKLHFLLRAGALVVFPGGFGTLDELFETLNLVQSRKIKPLPVILVGEQYWRGVFDPDFLLQEGVIDAEDRELFWYAESATEIWEHISDWYRRADSSLICCPA